MDVLRERTAAMNLGGSRGEFHFSIGVGGIGRRAACHFSGGEREQKRDSDESGFEGQRGELVPKVPYVRVDSVPLFYFSEQSPSHCGTYPNTRLITNTQSPPNY